MTATRHLPPWLTVSTGPAPAVIDGRSCRTRAALFDETARVLRFPDYFGRNWDAFADSLGDAVRAGTTALIVVHAEDLLSAEPPEQYTTLLDILAVASRTGLTLTLHTPPGRSPSSAHEPPRPAALISPRGQPRQPLQRHPQHRRHHRPRHHPPGPAPARPAATPDPRSTPTRLRPPARGDTSGTPPPPFTSDPVCRTSTLIDPGL